MAGENIVPCVRCVYFRAVALLENVIGQCHHGPKTLLVEQTYAGQPEPGCGKGFTAKVEPREAKIQALAVKAQDFMAWADHSEQDDDAYVFAKGIIEIAGKKVHP